MADFTAALQRGFERVSQAAGERAEITMVVSDLSMSVSRATNGIVSIARTTIPAETDFEPPHTALTASSSAASIRLAGFTPEDGGYPVQLDVGASTWICRDREDLEHALASMLEDLEVARAIRGLMESAQPSSD